MQTKKAMPTDIIMCPHCNESPDYDGSTAAEFVVPNRVGAASRSHCECTSCFGEFDAEFDGTYVVISWEPQ